MTCSDLRGKSWVTGGTIPDLFKKGYYSRDRDSEIVVDISIEIWLPDADTWSFVWIFECKDYGGAIPVSDVEEFRAKLDQIAGKNVKGILVFNGALQKSALSYARSNGIGVARILPDEQVSWVFYQRARVEVPSGATDIIDFDSALTNLQFSATNQSLFGDLMGRRFLGWGELMKDSLSA